jgi:hypothetical protein
MNQAVVGSIDRPRGIVFSEDMVRASVRVVTFSKVKP